MAKIEDFFHAPLMASRRQRKCPDCGGPLVKRTSTQHGVLCREIIYQCEYPFCGASFKGYEEIVYRLKVPSQTNPLVRLPRSPSQKHASAIKFNGHGCPECGERVRTQLVPTTEPMVFAAYAECARNGCTWAAAGSVVLEATEKEPII